jgi:hypothetical protein
MYTSTACGALKLVALVAWMFPEVCKILTAFFQRPIRERPELLPCQP